MIKGYSFYSNYYEIIKYLDDEQRLIMYDAINRYMFEDEEPVLNGLLNGIWSNIKMPLDTSKKNISNGSKGGRPKTEIKPKQNPKKTETKPKQNPKETEIKPNLEPKPKANNISYFLFLISNNKYKYIKEDNTLYTKIYEWLEYKEEKKECYKEKGLKSLLTQIENNVELYGEDKVIKLIDRCMASNYKGIIFEILETKEKPIMNNSLKQSGEVYARL